MSDPNLFRLLAASAKSQRLRVVDDGGRLTVHPLGFPMGFVWTCLAVPSAVFIGLAVYRIATGLAESFEYWIYAWIAVGIPAIFVFFTWFFRFLNSLQMAPGPFFILDRSARTLTLPRLDRTLSADDILGFAQVHEWHTTRDDEGTSSDWIAELSVLTSDATGEITRLPVVTSMRTDQVNRLGQLLAEFFGRPRQLIRPGFWEAVRGMFTSSSHIVQNPTRPVSG